MDPQNLIYLKGLIIPRNKLPKYFRIQNKWVRFFIIHCAIWYHSHMTVLIDNRKAHFNFEVIEKYEAGIELFGFEVKSIKSGRAILAGAFAIVRGGEVYLMNMQIPPYQVGNTPESYDPTRTRRLLLSKKQINSLASSDGMKGLTLVPFSLYSKGRLVKVELAVVKGKKNYDKRETIKKRDVEREISREYKR